MLKFLILFFSISAFSQNQISGKITLTDSNSDYKFITVLLKKNDSIYTGSQVNDAGVYKFLKKVPNGIYKIELTQIGYKNMIIENINVTEKDLVLDLNYPGECKYKKDRPGKCVNGHTDKIIPIVYGLPTNKTMKKAKRGKVHLGGCIISQCDSYFYCTIHNKEL